MLRKRSVCHAREDRFVCLSAPRLFVLPSNSPNMVVARLETEGRERYRKVGEGREVGPF